MGRLVVRLKGGDPFVFGRGGEEALALVEAGTPFEIVPGVSSAIAAPAYAGIPVTQRNVAGSLTIIAGQRSEEMSNPENLVLTGLDADTLVFLMGVRNLPAIIHSLLSRGRSPETPVAIIEQGTLPAQKVVTGTLADILDRSTGIQPPSIIVVGEVVQLREKLSWFEGFTKRPLSHLRILNTRPPEAHTRDAFSEKLRNLGAQVLEQPAFRIVPTRDPSGLDQAIRMLETGPGWDWIVFSSASAVQAFLDRIQELGYDLRLLAGARLGAVGEATNRALEGYHLKADFIPVRYTGLDWADEAGDLAGKSILLPRSQIGSPELVQALKKRQAKVDTVTAYSVEPAKMDPEILELLLNRKIDWLTFFSPSAVRGLFEMMKTEVDEAQVRLALEKVHIACIGPTTEKEVQNFGLQPKITASVHSADGLVEALVKCIITP